MGTPTNIFNASISDADKFVVTVGDNVGGADPALKSSFDMTTGTLYRFNMEGCTALFQLSISADGTHTDTDGEGTMGVADNSAISYYEDGVLLSDIEDGATAAAQFATALAKGLKAEDNAEGYESAYCIIDPASFAKKTMYAFNADTGSMGFACAQKIKSHNVSDGPSYRAKAGGEHHKAPPSYRLAKKGAVRSASLQKGEAIKPLDSHSSDGAKKGSNNMGHPPLAGGESVRGGSRGNSN